MKERASRARERWARAARLRDKGKTFKEIGQALGVGPQRARMMVLAARKVQNA
jgi:hypothetical protein